MFVFDDWQQYDSQLIKNVAAAFGFEFPCIQVSGRPYNEDATLLEGSFYTWDTRSGGQGRGRLLDLLIEINVGNNSMLNRTQMVLIFDRHWYFF